jgi:hypothetical protein
MVQECCGLIRRRESGAARGGARCEPAGKPQLVSPCPSAARERPGCRPRCAWWRAARPCVSPRSRCGGVARTAAASPGELHTHQSFKPCSPAAALWGQGARNRRAAAGSAQLRRARALVCAVARAARPCTWARASSAMHTRVRTRSSARNTQNAAGAPRHACARVRRALRQAPLLHALPSSACVARGSGAGGGSRGQVARRACACSRAPARGQQLCTASTRRHAATPTRRHARQRAQCRHSAQLGRRGGAERRAAGVVVCDC